jgi:hypothetical protein
VAISFVPLDKIELETKEKPGTRGFSSLTTVTPMNGRIYPQTLDETALLYP